MTKRKPLRKPRRKPKPQPPCDVDDCPALAAKGSDYCAVHAAMTSMQRFDEIRGVRDRLNARYPEPPRKERVY